MIEEWRDFQDYPDLFEVSNKGRVRNKSTGRILSQHVHKTGYCLIATKIGGRNGSCKTFRVHREVAKAFISNDKDLPIINHKDGDKTNNHIDNLEWCSYSHNSSHAYKLGLAVPRSQKKNQKLNLDQVNYVLENFKPRDKTNGARALGRKYGVDKSVIIKLIENSGYKT